MRQTIILIIIILVSCSNKIHKEVNYYENGDTLDVSFYDKDSMLCGEAKTYYPNGNLEFKGNFKKDMKNGLCSWYFENGHKKFEFYYKNDKEEGNCLSYDSINGYLFRKYIYRNGIKLEVFEYDSLGIEIEHIKIINPDTIPKYKKEFVKLSINKDSIYVGDEVKIEVKIDWIPENQISTISLDNGRVYIDRNENRVINYYIWKPYLAKESTLRVLLRIDEEGYFIYGYMKINVKDKNNN